MRGNLVRKQYLIAESQLEKVKRLASAQGTSAAEVVRQAIEAYDPERLDGLEEPELLELVSKRLREAIAATRRASRRVSRALEAVDGKPG